MMQITSYHMNDMTIMFNSRILVSPEKNNLPMIKHLALGEITEYELAYYGDDVSCRLNERNTCKRAL